MDLRDARAADALERQAVPEGHSRTTDITHAMADQAAELRADLEICMDALEHLTRTTLGPAILTQLGEAGENEVRLRIEYADKARQARIAALKAQVAELTERCRRLGVVADAARRVLGSHGENIDELDQALRDLDGGKVYPQSPVDNAGTTQRL